MDISEFVGLLIFLVAFTFSIVKKYLEERFKKKHPRKYAKQREEKEVALKELLHSLGVEEEFEEVVQPESRVERKEAPILEISLPQSLVSSPSKTEEEKERKIHLSPLLQMQSKKQMVLLHEIFGSPKAMEDESLRF